ncbi:hypothetical protein HDU80_010245 [Chytriomyces hyalinus]|nr:hypothetical protein HDU80_010245 [Chytriomyces hyalinus]
MSVEATPRQRSITRTAALETMPPEVLDCIVQFVDAESIIPLCHSLPSCKYISTAMFDFAQRFPLEYYTPSELWPDMYLPMIQNTHSKMTDFPIQHMHATQVYSRIIQKYGGNIHVPCSKNVLIYLNALPDVLSVHPGDNRSSSGWAEFLCGLADANKQIRSCRVDADSAYNNWSEVAKQLTRLQIHSLVWRDEGYLAVEIQDAFPSISGLYHVEVQVPEDITQNDTLSRCVNLKEISFMQLLHNASTAVVEDILRRIKGSRIQKVWCESPSPASYRIDLEALETISSEFLKHGWYKQKHHADDDKVCFAYRHS